MSPVKLTEEPCRWLGEPGSCDAPAAYVLTEEAARWPVCRTHLEPFVGHLLEDSPRPRPLPIAVQLITLEVSV